jgi:hypothetical protein
MSCSIILSDLDFYLFPERYPYYKNHFKEDLKNLYSENQSAQTIQNIKFKLKVINHCLNIQNNDVRCIVQHLYEKLIEYSFDWHKEYNWKELKIILFFFRIFSDCTTVSELENQIEKSFTKTLLEKYKP